MDTNKKTREYISAFADGELPNADLELALAALRETDGRQVWKLYHRIGDALRGEPGQAELSSGFPTRLADRLAAEPMPLRRGAGRPASPTEELAKIVPAVVAGADTRNGAKLVSPELEPHDPPVAGPGSATVKRV